MAICFSLFAISAWLNAYFVLLREVLLPEYVFSQMQLTTNFLSLLLLKAWCLPVGLVKFLGVWGKVPCLQSFSLVDKGLYRVSILLVLLQIKSDAYPDSYVSLWFSSLLLWSVY